MSALRTVILPLAHAGAGATWQALLSLLGVGLIVIVLLTAFRRIKMSSPGDLILPLAAVAVLSSMSGLATSALSDWVWLTVPVGVVSLAVLLLATVTSWELGPTSPLLGVALALSVIAVVTFDDPITRSWHPTPQAREFQTYPAAGISLDLQSPTEGTDVASNEIAVVVSLDGGSIGEAPSRDDVALEALLSDPTERGFIQVFLDGVAVEDPSGGPLRPDEACNDGCSLATYTLTAVAPGEHRIIVEFKSRDRIAFSPAVFEQAQITVGP